MLGKIHKKVIHFDNIIWKGNVVKDSLRIAEAFNSYFTHIGLNLAVNIPTLTKPFYTFLNNRNSRSIFFLPFRETEVIDMVSNMDPKKSAGYDGISNFPP